MKKLINDLRERFDHAILRGLEKVQALALGYDYDEVWAMGITCAQVGLRPEEIRDVILKVLKEETK